MQNIIKENYILVDFIYITAYIHIQYNREWVWTIVCVYVELWYKDIQVPKTTHIRVDDLLLKVNFTVLRKK